MDGAGRNANGNTERMMAATRVSSNLSLASTLLALATTPAAAGDGTEASRTLNADGTTSMTFAGELADLNTRIGLDVSAAAASAAPVPGARDTSLGGAAFAKLSLKALPDWLPWEKSSVDVRLDPGAETGRLATSFSRSWTLAPELTASLADSYAVARANSTGTWETAKSPSLRMEGTGTTFSVAAKAEEGLGRWQPSVSASQRLVEGFAITTTVIDTGSEIARSITAGFSQRW